MTRVYELMFIVDADVDDEGIRAALAKVGEMIVEEGGKVATTDEWGRRNGRRAARCPWGRRGKTASAWRPFDRRR